MNFRVLITLAACSAVLAVAPAQAHGRHHHHHHHGMMAKHDRMGHHQINDADHHNPDPTAPMPKSPAH